MMNMNKLEIKFPAGDFIETDQSGLLTVPDTPILGMISGDGVGPEVTAAGKMVWDAAVKKVYGGKRRLCWCELPAGNQSEERFGNALPEETVAALRKLKVAAKGPLTTQVSGGRRSLNVTLRRELDLYACVRPVRYYPGVKTPVCHPEKLDVVIFRENTEDVYCGLEYPAGSPETLKLAEFLKNELKAALPEAAYTGLGIKPISRMNSERLIRAAAKYAIAHGRKKITLVHKGNIMKYTEGAFRNWGYDLLDREFGTVTIRENSGSSEGKIVINDRICDDFLQQLLLAPQEYSVIAAPNLNGDYVSDAAAAQVGGIGIAPGANINYETGIAVFEATHGTAPLLAGKNAANPCSVILSGSMLLEHLDWQEAAQMVQDALSETLAAGILTSDLADGGKSVSCSGFAEAVCSKITEK